VRLLAPSERGDPTGEKKKQDQAHRYYDQWYHQKDKTEPAHQDACALAGQKSA
jgi:hypothetical protein